jgi:hypothetical protein
MKMKEPEDFKKETSGEEKEAGSQGNTVCCVCAFSLTSKNYYEHKNSFDTKSYQ